MFWLTAKEKIWKNKWETFSNSEQLIPKKIMSNGLIEYYGIYVVAFTK